MGAGMSCEPYRDDAIKDHSNRCVCRTGWLNEKALLLSLSVMWTAGPAVANSEDDSALSHAVAALRPATDASKADGAAAATTGALEEIIVTAQKRETGLEKTPIAESAFTPSSIEANRIQSIDDIALRVPSVSFVQLNKGEAYISMRGTLVNTPGAGWSDAVTVFIDDVPMTGMADNSPDLYDLKSIEVLRGPQGTLFGTNVTGGALVIHTQQPSFDEHGKAEVTYGLDNLAQFRGMWTGPLVGNELAGKITADVKYRDPYLNNVTLNDKTFGDTAGNVRGQLLWNPSDDLSILFSGDYTRDRSSGKIAQLSGSVEPSLYPNLSYGPYNTNQGVNSRDDKNVLGFSTRVDWNLSWGSFTSVTGFRDVRDSTPVSRLGDPDNQALKLVTILDKQFSEELRMASPAGDRLTWLGGLFYLHSNKREDDLYTYDLNPLTANGGAFPVPIVGVSQAVHQQVLDQVGAVFGEVSYAVVDDLKVIVGGRGQWERKNGVSSIAADFAPGNPLDAFYPFVFADAAASYSDTWRSFTPKAMLTYQTTNELMLYASATEGFKSGGWDTSAASDYGKSSAVVSQELATPFQPEKVWSYELGSKYLSQDRRFQANTAVFVADYRDMQTNNFNTQTAAFQTSNVGRARAKGIEIETTEAPTQWLTLGFNYTYEAAKYTSYVEANGTNYTGNAIPLTPKHNVHLSADTKLPLSQAGGDFNIGGDYTYRTAVHFADSNSEPAYLLDESKYDGIVNLHTTWNSSSDLWHVSLFVNNLTNRHTVVYGTDVSGFYFTPTEAMNSGNRVYSVTRMPTRLIGLTFRRTF
jgi:iron complex outermembrane recepter protein